MKTPEQYEAEIAAYKATSSDTPLTDMMLAEIPSPPWTIHIDGLAQVCRAFEKKNRDLEADVARWKKDAIPFVVVYAAKYGLDAYGEGCMYFAHYDLLEEAGARMDDFKRCGSDY